MRRITYRWARKLYGSAGSVPFTTVDWLHRMDTPAADGATPSLANLDSGTYGLATGSWSKTGADAFWTEEHTNSPSIPGLGLSDTSGAGAATGNAAFPMQTNPGVTFRGATFTFGTAKTQFSLGFAIRVEGIIDPPNDVGDLQHSVRIDGSSGGHYFIAGMEIHDVGKYKMFAHCSTTDGGYSGLMDVSQWYWVAMLWTNSTNCDLRVFGPLPSLTQVGSTSVGTKADAVSNAAAVRCFGRTDNTGQVSFNSMTHRSSCHAARFANVHPLLPT